MPGKNPAISERAGLVRFSRGAANARQVCDGMPQSLSPLMAPIVLTG